MPLPYSKIDNSVAFLFIFHFSLKKKISIGKSEKSLFDFGNDLNFEK